MPLCLPMGECMTVRLPAVGRLVLHAWQAALVAGVVVLVAHDGNWFGWLGPSSFIDQWVYDVLEVAAAVVGQRILAGVPSLSRIAALVRSTHEAWDGSGYPDGLTGEQIPLAARVIAVCDAFSAMTSHRPYRAARGAEEAIAELRRCAGTQFDPELVELFCRLRPDLAVESELAVAI